MTSLGIRSKAPQSAWLCAASLTLLQVAGACAPLDETEELAEEQSFDDGEELDDKALPSATYQAESNTARSACNPASNHGGYTGSGFMNFGGNGTWIEWNNVSVSLPGQYELRMRYANASGANRTAAILINGRTMGSLPFASTGDWENWQTGALRVSLVRGNNTIRVLANTSAGGPNLDRMDVVAIDLCPSDANKVEPGECGCGVREGSCGGSDGGSSTGAVFGRPSGTKVRIGSWNNYRGSVFPKSDATWRAINISAKDEQARVEGGARIFKAVDADVWLLQETVYSESALPSGVTVSDINSKLAQYMRGLTGEAWSVKCNGEGLCTMIRGTLRFAESWNPHHRVAGNRVILPDGSKVVLINVHYMNKLDQAQDTADIVRSAGSGDAAVFIGGDFNNGTTGPLYGLVATIPGIKALSMVHARNPEAIHLSESVARANPFSNTGGQVAFGGGPAGQDVVTAVNGGQIDHFFLRSSWGSQHRFILNSFLLSRETLAAARMTPLDVALEPEAYQPYFRDFASKGIVYELPADMRGIGHDHLPMFVDLTSP